MTQVTNLYNKDINFHVKIDFYDLEKTGSWDDTENQVLVITVSEKIGRLIKRTYHRRNPKRIKDLEIIREDNYWEMYFGGSYGASSLFEAVGQLIYYSEI